KGGSARGQMEKISAGKFHSEPPSPFTSFNHLVGDGEYARWDGEAERFGSLHVDDQLEFGRLQDRQIGRLLALENPAGEDADLAVRIRPSGAIANQTTGRDGLAPFVDRWNRIVFCQ